MAVPVGMPDHALLTRARDGDGEAFEALYRRHHRAATRAAHSYSSRSQLAEDAVQEAFMRILHATQEGGGPITEFRAYLATTVRHVIAGWTRGERTFATDDLEALVGEDVRDTSRPESRLRWHLLTKAFKSLPTRWQEALWLGEVEGVAPAELAERWNMSANSAAALAYRAREGLRTAWLDAHVNEGLVPDECRPYVTDLSRYTQGKLTDRRETQVRGHLDDCEYCRAVLFEVDVAASELRVLLLPVALWGGLGLAGAGLALGPLAWVAKTLGGMGRRGLAFGAASTAAVVVVVIVAVNPGSAEPPGSADDGRSLVATTSSDDGSTTTTTDDSAEDDEPADEPSDEPTETASEEVAEEPAPTPTPDAAGPTTITPVAPTPTAPATTNPEPTTTPEPTPEPTPTAPPTTDPTDEPAEEPAPTAPEVSVAVVDGSIVLSGSGEPDATVTIEVADTASTTATTGSGTTGRSVMPRGPVVLAGTEVATAVVDVEGSWTVTPDVDRVAGLTVVATQTTTDGRQSPASDPVPLPSRPAAPVITDVAPTQSDPSVRIDGTGIAGATVQVHGPDGSTIATATVGEGGAWQAMIPWTPDLAGTEVVAVQVVPNGMRSPASPSQELPRELPPVEPEPLVALTMEITVDEAGVTFTGSGQPGASVAINSGNATIATAEIDSDANAEGMWTTTIPANPELSGVEVIATQTFEDRSSQSPPRSIPEIAAPEVPDAPTIQLGFIVGTNVVTASGSAVPGATVELRTTAGARLADATADASGQWFIPLTLIPDGIDAVAAVQIVNGIESPASPAVRLDSIIIIVINEDEQRSS